MKDPFDKLTDGLDETQRQELGDLKNLVELLESESVSDPGKEEQVRLLAALESYMPVSTVPQTRDLGNWLRLALGQLVLFESSFWLAGALVLLLGLFLTAIDGRELLPLAFVLLTPLLAVVGVAHAFRPETRTLGELERLTATGAAELLYTRLALVLAFILLLSLFLLLLIWLEGPQVVLWRLVLAWLGPMLALTGLALYITIRWDPLIGAVIPLGLWGSLALLGWREALLRVAEGMTPTAWLLVEVSSSGSLLIGSFLACIFGLALLVLAGRTVTRKRPSWS
jgi:hypothetical protein